MCLCFSPSLDGDLIVFAKRSDASCLAATYNNNIININCKKGIMQNYTVLYQNYIDFIQL